MNAITADEILAVLHAIERGEVTVEKPKDAWCGNKPIACSNGWTITVFADCFQWDYIASVTAADGRVAYVYDETPEENASKWAIIREDSMGGPSPRCAWSKRLETNSDGLAAIRDYGPPAPQAETIWGFEY